MKNNPLRTICVSLLMLLAGCTTIDARRAGEMGGKSLWSFGITRITLPDATDKLSAIDAKTLGLGWDRGPYLGWKAGNWIIADPAECQLIVVIRSVAQAESAAKVLQSLKGQQPCIIDYTRSLQR